MPTFNLIALKYQDLCNYYSELTNSPNEFTRSMAKSATKILGYHMSLETTVTELHFIGLLCDPLLKDDAHKINKFWRGAREVNLDLNSKINLRHETCLRDTLKNSIHPK